MPSRVRVVLKLESSPVLRGRDAYSYLRKVFLRGKYHVPSEFERLPLWKKVSVLYNAMVGYDIPAAELKIVRERRGLQRKKSWYVQSLIRWNLAVSKKKKKKKTFKMKKLVAEYAESLPEIPPPPHQWWFNSPTGSTVAVQVAGASPPVDGSSPMVQTNADLLEALAAIDGIDFSDDGN